jgi:hypothetical protein
VAQQWTRRICPHRVRQHDDAIGGGGWQGFRDSADSGVFERTHITNQTTTGPYVVGRVEESIGRELR